MQKQMQRTAARPAVAHSSEKMTGPRGLNSGMGFLTRRRFLVGAAGIGAAALALGAGNAVLTGRFAPQEASRTGLSVPADAVTSLDDLILADDAGERLAQVGTLDMPLGTLVWSNSDDVAVALVPGEQGRPLAGLSLIFLDTVSDAQVLADAIGAAAGYELFDARASSQGVVWIEENVLNGAWRVYTAPIEGRALGEASLVDEGDATLETPTLAAVKSAAFWQVQPQRQQARDADAPPATLKRALFGSPGGASAVEEVFSSARRMATPVYAATDAVVIASRAGASSTSYELACLDADSGSLVDSLTLPQTMKPLEAAYGPTGFSFCLENIYESFGGLARLGTYAPRIPANSSAYDDAPWFCFSRNPTAPPAWCGGRLIVKSSRSVCGVDLEAGEYFALEVDNGADDYGSYLATTGSHDALVTYTSIDYQPVNAEAVKTCRVKIYRARA